MKKSTKVFLGITTGVIAVGATTGIVVAINNNKKVVETQDLPGTLQSTDQSRPAYNPTTKPNKPTEKPTKPETSKPVETPNNGNSNEISQASAFSFSTFQAKPIEVESAPTVEREAASRITKDFQSGWIQLSSDKNDKVFQSSEYYNQRDFMPILSDSWKMRNYANERDTGAVLNHRYNGWDSSESYYDVAGNPLTLGQYENHALTYITYRATDALIKYTEKNNLPLPQKQIRMVMLDCNLFKGDTQAKKINEYLEYASKVGINFITIRSATQQQLEKIVIPTGTKKLTILDHERWNFNKSKLESFRGITIPETVQELEFYSNTCKKVDPLILSKNTHMIYDHITDIRNYYVNQANFETIDLSARRNLSEKDLQKAIDTVYVERQYERAFHGYFLGGYISNLDLSNTGITTLNNVVIPSQKDGRFNIAYVKWTSNNNSGSTSIVITDSDKPSNDSMVGEWYDPTANESKVTKLVAKTVRTVSVEVAAKEIVGQIKKYPNIKDVDIKEVHLSNGTHDQLIDLVMESFKDPNGRPIKMINFIKPN